MPVRCLSAASVGCKYVARDGSDCWNSRWQQTAIPGLGRLQLLDRRLAGSRFRTSRDQVACRAGWVGNWIQGQTSQVYNRWSDTGINVRQRMVRIQAEYSNVESSR